MDRGPPSWQLALARIEGALPFLRAEVADGLARASLRRLWRVHVRDYAFENLGPEHNPGLGAAELTRSWYAAERQDFLSWISRRGPPPLARAAQLTLAAKDARESFSAIFAAADRALERLDVLLPTRDPLAALTEWLHQLRDDEVDFLEGGSEEVLIEGRVFQRFAARGSAWAASLAAAMRPQLFGLGAAPLALAGLAPRETFRAEPERQLTTVVASVIGTAAGDVATDLAAVSAIVARGEAHMRLCASRAVYVRAYPRETQEMVFDAHARGFAFFGGVPLRGIYDNMKTAVTSVFVGKERVFNRRFLVMADHYMVEPTACSPAAGWEKGQVENQVQTIRGRFFQPRLRFASIEELNGWLEAECLRWAALHPHPEQKELTVAEALDLERSALQPMLAPFDGFHETAHAVTGTCLISFDRNRYSVMAKAARRAVQVRAYADRIVVRLGDEVIAEHARYFGRDRTIYDPWHYLPVLANKPGAWRNGAPFHGWNLPPALTRLRRKLGSGDEADRRFVRVLAAVLTDGLEAVEAAIREALDAGAASDEVILNILARYREPATDRPLDLVVDLKLNHPPIADCARYDTVRGLDAAA